MKAVFSAAKPLAPGSGMTGEVRLQRLRRLVQCLGHAHQPDTFPQLSRLGELGRVLTVRKHQPVALEIPRQQTLDVVLIKANAHPARGLKSAFLDGRHRRVLPGLFSRVRETQLSKAGQGVPPCKRHPRGTATREPGRDSCVLGVIMIDEGLGPVGTRGGGPKRPE